MSTHEPAKDALIYRGNLGSDLRRGPLTEAFANVTGSSQHYRVRVQGHAFEGPSGELHTLDFLAAQLALIVSEQNLQDEPDINKVATQVHRYILAVYNLRQNPRPFHDCPVIATLHKPSQIKTFEEILASVSDEDRARFLEEMDAPSPVNTPTPENV